MVNMGIVARKALIVAAMMVSLALPAPAPAASAMSLGPRALQALVSGQLFNRNGRWYLIDDGACHTYLESPHVRLAVDRLVLNAHLVSRLGQRIGDGCAGADFASNVTLSGKLRGSEHKLVLEDIRIDRVDDEATRNALNLALQIAPQTLPREAAIDVLELLRQQVLETGGLAVHLDQFHIVNIAPRADAVVIQFDVSLSAP